MVNNLFQSFILGAVQGLGEFLPISSSGHLVLVHALFKKDLGLGFDVMLHLGTLIAVVFYFRQDILNMARGFWHSLFRKTRDLSSIYQKLPIMVLVATLPAVIFGIILKPYAETIFRNPVLVALSLAVFGIVIWLSEKFGKKSLDLNSITLKSALVIGWFQALAIVPGVSRSGATIAAAMFLAYKRPDAARFSFLLSLPIIFGAVLVEANNIELSEINLELAVGFISSLFFGFFAIKYLLKYISKNSFNVFVWYRLALSGLILLVYYLK